MESLTQTLIELMEMAAPTGQEEPVLAWCREKWAAAGAEVRTTPVGNVLARIPGDGPKLLLQGHADEIGFVVKSIDERGFVWLADGQAGSRNFSERYPVGQPALIVARNARIEGVFGAPTGHVLSTKADRGKTPSEDDIFVDIGVDLKDEAQALGVHVGAGVIWNPPVRRIGNRISGKAIDNRVSLALMTHLLTDLDHSAIRYDLTVAATVQEEIGLIGALSLGQAGPFDLAIAIDNGPIADYPGTSLREMPVQLGKGPTLVYKDSWAHYDRRIIDRLLDVAETNDIPVQRTIYPGFGSDGAALIRTGIPAALLAVSTRYTHSPFEMLDERDLIGAFELLRAFITSEAQPLPLGPS
jgi:putative aminopeptidase FrvX